MTNGVFVPDAGRTPKLLELQRVAEPDGVVLVLRGEVDLASAPELEHELRAAEQARPDRLVIDLRGVSFMDCVGLAVLIQAQQSAHQAGHLLAVRRGPRQVQRLFELAGLADRFEFLD